jgi:hypothetical protein
MRGARFSLNGGRHTGALVVRPPRSSPLARSSATPQPTRWVSDTAPLTPHPDTTRLPLLPATCSLLPARATPPPCGGTSAVAIGTSAIAVATPTGVPATPTGVPATPAGLPATPAGLPATPAGLPATPAGLPATPPIAVATSAIRRFRAPQGCALCGKDKKGRRRL